MRTENFKQKRVSGLLPLFIVCILLSTLIGLSGFGLAQSEEVHVFIDGPDILQTNTTVEYTIKVTGGPAEEATGNFSFTARLDGKDLDLEQTKVEPNNGTSPENTFKVNVTTPMDAKTITLIVNGTSFTNLTNIAWSGDVLQAIAVFEPIIVNISAIIRNPGSADIKGALISFYVDGRFIGNRTEDVDADSSKMVYMEWIAAKTDEGEHDIEVRINEDETLLEFDNGDNVIQKVIYLGDRPEREQGPIMLFNTGLVVLILMIALFFLFGGIWMWRETVRGRSYYSSAATNVTYFVGILMIILSLPVFAVSQIIAENSEDVSGDPFVRMVQAVVIFALGFVIIFLNWDRTRRKKR